MTQTSNASQNSYEAVPYGPVFKDAEETNFLPPFLLVEVARAESGFNPKAFNPKAGATGIMQIVPKYHPGVDPLDPIASIHYAGQYLQLLYIKTGSWAQALAAYNWGIGNLEKFGFAKIPQETRNYIAQIKGRLPYALA